MPAATIPARRHVEVLHSGPCRPGVAPRGPLPHPRVMLLIQVKGRAWAHPRSAKRSAGGSNRARGQSDCALRADRWSRTSLGGPSSHPKQHKQRDEDRRGAKVAHRDHNRSPRHSWPPVGVAERVGASALRAVEVSEEDERRRVQDVLEHKDGGADQRNQRENAPTACRNAACSRHATVSTRGHSASILVQLDERYSRAVRSSTPPTNDRLVETPEVRPQGVVLATCPVGEVGGSGVALPPVDVVGLGVFDGDSAAGATAVAFCQGDPLRPAEEPVSRPRFNGGSPRRGRRG